MSFAARPSVTRFLPDFHSAAELVPQSMSSRNLVTNWIPSGRNSGHQPASSGHPGTDAIRLAHPETNMHQSHDRTDSIVASPRIPEPFAGAC